MSNSYVIGIDIGGSKIECALVQIKNNYRHWLTKPPPTFDTAITIVSRERTATEREQGYQHILTKIAHLITSTCQQHQVNLNSLAGIGIGLPGAVDNNMKMVNGNTLALIDQDLPHDLRKAINFTGTCICENDANCFVLAEALGKIGLELHHRHHIPLDKQVAVGIILGTGLGGGLFCHGHIYRGKNNSALELGHYTFVRDGIMCYCGRKGCAEQYLSGSALEAHFNQHRTAQVKRPLPAAEIFALAAKQDPTAVASINQYRQYLAQLLADISNIFDPHYIVLGGGISQQASIYHTLAEDMQRELFVKKNPPQIRRNELGDSSGVLGAAMLPLLAAGE